MKKDWIPVEERLPETGKPVDTTILLSSGRLMVVTDWINTKEKTWVNYGDMVIAWKEKSEPYMPNEEQLNRVKEKGFKDFNHVLCNKYEVSIPYICYHSVDAPDEESAIERVFNEIGVDATLETNKIILKLNGSGILAERIG